MRNQYIVLRLCVHKGEIKVATTQKKPIHVNVDETLKEEAEQLFDDLGLNMTSAITMEDLNA